MPIETARLAISSNSKKLPLAAREFFIGPKIAFYINNLGNGNR